MNRVFDECNKILLSEKGQEWIVVAEDFEKFGIEVDPLRRLFIDYSLLFEQLTCHMLFVIPVGLAYTEDAERMPFGRERQYTIPDIAVYTRMGHEADEKGLGALLDVLYRRVDGSLLDDGVARSLCIASGGNIRDLFDLLRHAGIAAEARGGSRIQWQDALEAANAVRSNYRFRLGESIYDGSDAIGLATKVQKLAEIYHGKAAAQIPDKTLYVLLRLRMVLQFNGKVWFGVHPLVVDILKEQDSSSTEPVDRGGTDLHGS